MYRTGTIGTSLRRTTEDLLKWPENTDVDGAHLLLYRSDGTLHADIKCEAAGHECRVPEDTYTILVSNSDCSNAECMNHELHYECCMCAKAHPTEEGVLQHVQNVYCIGEHGIEVKPGNRVCEVTLYPQNRVKYLHFDIDPTYVDDIQQMQLRMTGWFLRYCWQMVVIHKKRRSMY